MSAWWLTFLGTFFGLTALAVGYYVVASPPRDDRPESANDNGTWPELDAALAAEGRTMAEEMARRWWWRLYWRVVPGHRPGNW